MRQFRKNKKYNYLVEYADNGQQEHELKLVNYHEYKAQEDAEIADQPVLTTESWAFIEEDLIST